MAHVEHCDAEGPVHEAQLAWHGTHVSAAVALARAQVKPTSIWSHVPLQPSPSTWLPSSQVSEPTRFPSPQMAVQVSGDAALPPVQVKPDSISHSELHPSPDAVLLSSHVSAQSTRIPSPQIAAHVSRPPTPVPNVFELVQLKPTSMLQSESHPSPPMVLLSSHISFVDRLPSPHT